MKQMQQVWLFTRAKDVDLHQNKINEQNNILHFTKNHDKKQISIKTNKGWTDLMNNSG